MYNNQTIVPKYQMKEKTRFGHVRHYIGTIHYYSNVDDAIDNFQCLNEANKRMCQL